MTDKASRPLVSRRGFAFFLVLALVLGTFASPAPALAQGRDQRTAAIGFYVFNVRDVDLKTQRFAADFYAWMRYHGEADKDLERFEFANGRVDSITELERATLKTGEQYVCWRVAATFQVRYTLRQFPFDFQRLEILVEHPAYEYDQLLFQHDEPSYKRSPAPKERWGIKTALSIPDFKVVGTELKAERYSYETDFGHVETASVGSNYSRLGLVIKIERIPWPYLYKFMIPFLVILGVAYLAFWVPPQEVVASSLLAVVSLLSSVAFHLTVARDMPDTGYLMVSDKFFIATIFIIFGILIQSIATYNLSRAGRDEAAYKLDVVGRVAFPIIYGAAFTFLLLSAMQADR